jgi:hypothetical protein
MHHRPAFWAYTGSGGICFLIEPDDFVGYLFFHLASMFFHSLRFKKSKRIFAFRLIRL